MKQGKSKTNDKTDARKEITDKLENGIKELLNSEKYQQYLAVMAKFHHYSFNNILLILMQKPDATLIAGYNAWKTDFSRNVKKGEKGIRIIAPCHQKIIQEVDVIDPATNKPKFDEKGNPIQKKEETMLPRYKITTVFDVSQTEGKELPEMKIESLQGRVENYSDLFDALASCSPVPVSFEMITSGAKGYFNHVENRIAINITESEQQTIKTLVHEITHAKLHNDKASVNAPDKPDRNTREVEAESVACVVCAHYGLDTIEYSAPYIALWSKDSNISEMKNSLAIIQKTANEIITAADLFLTERKKEIKPSINSEIKNIREVMKETVSKQQPSKEEPCL